MARHEGDDVEKGDARKDTRAPGTNTNSSRSNGHANGINGTADGGSPNRKGPPRRLPASDDPLDDLEDGPLLSEPTRSDKQTFGIEQTSIEQLESVRWQNTAGGEGLSILGGAFVPEEKRRRCCGVVLCAAAGVLLLCVAALTVIFLVKGPDVFGEQGWFFQNGSGLNDTAGFSMAPSPWALAPGQLDDYDPDMNGERGVALGPAVDTGMPGQQAAVPVAEPTIAGGIPQDVPGDQVPQAGPPAQLQQPVQQPPLPQQAPAPVAAQAEPAGLAPAEIPARGDLYFQPHARWIYQLPRTWTQEDFDQTKLSTDLAYSHMAMLTQLPNGSLASLMQASTVPGEGNAQQALYWQVSDDWGDTWTTPRTVLPPYISPNGQQLPYWSPVLHTQDGVVYLFYSVSVEACVFLTRTQYDTNRWTPGGNIMMVKSQDNGESWSQPQVLFTFEDEGGIPKVIANKLALTPTGAWLLPFWRENDRWDAGAGCNAQPGLMGVPAVLVSSNQGGSWMVSESVSHGGALPYNWMIENTIAPVTNVDGSPGLLQLLAECYSGRSAHLLDSCIPDAKVMLGILKTTPPSSELFRTEKGKPIFQSRSSDGGFHWTMATPTALANPDSKVHAVALPNGDLLLAYDDDANLRTPLALAMSRDGGASWHRVVAVEEDHCGQFSYPTIQYIPQNGMIFVAYTVLFLPASMPSDCRAMYGKIATNTTEGLPPSGMRVYVTTEAVLRQQFQMILAETGK